jgi:hypothetical protein
MKACSGISIYLVDYLVLMIADHLMLLALKSKTLAADFCRSASMKQQQMILL